MGACGETSRHGAHDSREPARVLRRINATWFLSERIPTNRIEGRITASQIAATSDASFFCRRTTGVLRGDRDSRRLWGPFSSRRLNLRTTKPAS
jgi:hypothetical protein